MLAGVGVAMLPGMYCRDEIARGDMEVVLPQWDLPMGVLHAVFPSRKGVTPPLRRFLDFLAEVLPETARRVGMMTTGIVPMHAAPPYARRPPLAPTSTIAFAPDRTSPSPDPAHPAHCGFTFTPVHTKVLVRRPGGRGRTPFPTKGKEAQR